MYMYARMRMYVCMCVCVRACVCVFVQLDAIVYLKMIASCVRHLSLIINPRV